MITCIKDRKRNNGRVSPLLLMLSVMFVSFLLMSNVLANRMVQFGPWAIDAGTLTFPITYVLSDVFSEVYGYRWSRRVTWYATIVNTIMALMIALTIKLPAPEWFESSHFQLALGQSWRIVVASLVSYFFGDWANDIIFRFMKKEHVDIKGMGLRAIVSSIGGSIVDTSLFVIIAFTGSMPANEMVPMILISVVLKTVYEVIVLPLTILVAKKVEEYEIEYSKEGNYAGIGNWS